MYRAVEVAPIQDQPQAHRDPIESDSQVEASVAGDVDVEESQEEWNVAVGLTREGEEGEGAHCAWPSWPWMV